MNFKELLEGAEPKMPGAPKGISIMTPQQFVAKAGDMPDEEEVDEGYPKHQDLSGVSTEKLNAYLDKQAKQSVPGEGSQVKRVQAELQRRQQGVAEGSENFTITQKKDHSYPGSLQVVITDKSTGKQKVIAGDPRKIKQQIKQEFGIDYNFGQQGVAEGSIEQRIADKKKNNPLQASVKQSKYGYSALVTYKTGETAWRGGAYWQTPELAMGHAKAFINGYPHLEQEYAQRFIDKNRDGIAEQGVAEGMEQIYNILALDKSNALKKPTKLKWKASSLEDIFDALAAQDWYPLEINGIEVIAGKRLKQGVAESLEQLNRIRKLSGLAEATALPASTRDLKGQEFQDYMNRIKGTDDIDKKTGQVKLDKKGNEKYVSGKTKSDKYKMPYIHRSSIIEYLGPDGKTYDEDKIKQSLSQRPKSLLKQNEKMKHSNGEFEQFFNVGFAALTGIAVDEQTNNLIIVNTCPGAGSCKVDCFAMKGGKVQFKAAWQSDGRILTYLLNDPSGFFNQLSSEIAKEEAAGKKGDKKFPNGWQTTIRWHDAGDFFSPEYLDMALKMAAKHPDVKFYAYTKMAGAALAQKPPNFIINWSEGANTSQEKQVKAKDANLDTTKNSRIVPDDLFQDLLVKDEKKNLVKGEQGQWQVQPDKLPELKQRLASEYGLSANSILDYNEYMAKRKSIPAGMKYNVIVAPGEGDISANDPNIISTLLLKH